MAGRGGRGGGRGRGRGFGAGALPPMGLSFADIQSMSREATALYPPMRAPVMNEPTEKEKRITQLQIEFTSRLRKSEYYLVESTKSTELPRYSDKYRPSTTSQPTLKRSDLHAPFFPPEIFEAFFNPKKKSKARKQTGQKRKLNLDEMLDDDEANESAQEGSDAGGSQGEPDYDTEEEYDNDYADNYFDNGEGENFDDLGDGGGGDDGGVGGDYD
ncbi:DNA-directed RNA polymerase III, subunit Rpc31 [Lentinula aff. lateritia]|uniref:DNA-directed RNA polymerase III, subunit Rpc31 n=1 Tax=Lentinula aff. lateritia TaxID=2804960 RepID=A0ACC1UDT6_9AGAR|nr:DNA-directed RNA polymerase III, subunit Rpc31 [Lentinula aff. lateritia]